MFGLGPFELIVVLVIVLIFFGVGKLPQLGTGLGEGIKNFKKAYEDEKALDVTPDEQKDAEKKEQENETPE